MDDMIAFLHECLQCWNITLRAINLQCAGHLPLPSKKGCPKAAF
jgi:hypothetical protein